MLKTYNIFISEVNLIHSLSDIEKFSGNFSGKICIVESDIDEPLFDILPCSDDFNFYVLKYKYREVNYIRVPMRGRTPKTHVYYNSKIKLNDTLFTLIESNEHNLGVHLLIEELISKDIYRKDGFVELISFNYFHSETKLTEIEYYGPLQLNEFTVWST